MRKLGLIILAIVVLLTLAGGGVAVYLLIIAPKSQSEAEAVDPNDPPPPPVPKRPAFIPLEPFSVYVRPEGQPSREIIVILHLEVPPDNVPQVNEKMHLLRDAYIRELLKGDPIEVPARFTARDLYVVRDRLRAPTEQVMGKGLVTQVLLLNIIGQLK
ncbi:MAG: flagellar basal body-associated protein FliL [Ferrovibrio sp.]|jgi:flagellar basal body-associated protein FliL|uniref:flagellar basal body-associated FliL family protein n=1 Tax=Ferrovibrio sp. TaxID=1917215 RepID=UPI00391B3815